MLEKKNKILVCDDCGKEFKVNIWRRDFIVKGEQFKAQFFMCPRCRRTFILCIDNEETIKMHNGELKPSQELVKKYKAIQEYLILCGVDLRHIMDYKQRKEKKNKDG